MLDTFPKVMKLCFPQVEYELNKTDLYATFVNGSEYWFGGLDDKERVEKILGNEFATIHLNECSQIPYGSRNVAVTRLAQLVKQNIDGVESILPLRMFYDENPPDKGHWTYKLFVTKTDPETRGSLPDPENYASMQMNPVDNLENLGEGYLKTLQGLSVRMRTRFLDGKFRETAPNALFTDESIDRWREIGELPEMLRIVVAVDPSGADDEDNVDNDEIGIVVGGLGIDGNGYCLADLTCKAGPAVWGKVAVDAYLRERADRIVAEVNYGGAMVGFVIKQAAAKAKTRVPYRTITASRGKTVRAEPISALVETGKVRFAGQFTELEEELCAFTTHGYMGEKSPNRADAFIWAMYDLFPSLIDDKPKEEKREQVIIRRGGPNAWMHT